MPTALHVFDMDGTLLRNTTASREISRCLGVTDEIDDLERRLRAREIGDADFAVGIRTLWADLDAATVDEVVADSPWIDGIDEVCADIAARGETSMLVTLSPDFFARHLHARGLEIVHASAFPPLPFAAPIDPAGILSAAAKVELTELERGRRDLPTTACVAYGDSVSDAALFAHLPHTVAVNADDDLEALAAAAYRGNDLREAYALGRALLDG